MPLPSGMDTEAADVLIAAYCKAAQAGRGIVLHNAAGPGMPPVLPPPSLRLPRLTTPSSPRRPGYLPLRASGASCADPTDPAHTAMSTPATPSEAHRTDPPLCHLLLVVAVQQANHHAGRQAPEGGGSSTDPAQARPRSPSRRHSLHTATAATTNSSEGWYVPPAAYTPTELTVASEVSGTEGYAGRNARGSGN